MTCPMGTFQVSLPTDDCIKIQLSPHWLYYHNSFLLGWLGPPATSKSPQVLLAAWCAAMNRPECFSFFCTYVLEGMRYLPMCTNTYTQKEQSTPMVCALHLPTPPCYTQKEKQYSSYFCLVRFDSNRLSLTVLMFYDCYMLSCINSLLYDHVSEWNLNLAILAQGEISIHYCVKQ